MGACLCGAIRYELDAPSLALTHCHCSMCRKHHGAAFASFVEGSTQALHWISGEREIVDYPSSAVRVRRFCAVCGSVAPTPVADRVRVPAGNLLGEFGVTGGRHVFVASKAPWHVIADALPQHGAAAPDWAASELDRPSAPCVEGATHGSCLCGEVTFAVSGAPARWLQCHCSRCRRARSAAHGSNAFYPLAQFAWRTGREQVRTYRPPDAQRFAASFCERCGGGAPSERDNVPFVLVPAGLLDQDPGFRPEAHIHIASKAPWYAVHDSLAQFAELPPP